MKAREQSESRLESSDISQIAEFGHHPTQLFDRPHPVFEDKTYESTRLVFDVFNEQQRYMALQYRQKEGEFFTAIRIMVKDKNNLVVVNSNNELVRKQYKLVEPSNRLLGGKNECRNIGQPNGIGPYFGICSAGKEVFATDPQSIFTFSGEYIIACRDCQNDFSIYGFQSLTFVISVAFHKVICSSNRAVDCG